MALSDPDDLYESYILNILDIDHVKKAEIFLFNNKNQLILVASGRNTGQEPFIQKEIKTNSYLLKSTRESNLRRIKRPIVSSVFAIPLQDTDSIIGFLYIHLNKILIPAKDYLNNFYFTGIQLSAKLKEVRLDDEIKELKHKLQSLSVINTESQRRITSLSKELFAITAISTKINQSVHFDQSLQKSMAVIRKVFRESRMLIYTLNLGTGKHELSASDCAESELNPLLLKNIEKTYLTEVISLSRPIMKDLTSEYQEKGEKHELAKHFKTLIAVPLKSKEATMGAVFLLNRTHLPYDQDSMRLLSGMANIMGMAIENKHLYRQNLQKKNEASFLFQSIIKFNEKLDLKETLKSVAQKGAEFTGKKCSVYLFSETGAPLIKSTYVTRSGENMIESSLFEKIIPQKLKEIYRFFIPKDRSVLITNVNRSRRITMEIRHYCRELEIHSLVAIVLRVRKKKLGLLLFIRSKDELPFDKDDLSFGEALASAASLAIENARAYTASLEMSDFLEQKITEKSTQIQQLQEKQKNRVENRKDIVFRVNNKNRYVFVNKAMELLTGLSKEELCHQDFPADLVVAEEDRGQVNYYFRKIVRKELPLARGIEYRQLNRKGEDHIISLTIYPETDESGTILGVEGVGIDISEKKRLETELKKARELALLGEFSSAVAHQIRNPLGNILMGTKLLEKALIQESRSSLPAMQKNDCNNSDKLVLGSIFTNLSEGIQNLNRVVTELLEYTKTLKLSFCLQRIDIILEETLEIFRDDIKNNQIEVEKNYDHELPLIHIDALLVGQVFRNVIHNSIQAMSDGGILKVCCGYSRQIKGYLNIQISDNGQGINPSEIDKIFRPFFTTKDSGTGLGLSLAYRIVEAHQGCIWASNNADKGSTIHILLPLNQTVNLRKQQI